MFPVPEMTNGFDMRVVVAVHKPYSMPDDPVYLPVQVGSAGRGSIGFIRDDDGPNISARNANWCELTGLYWAWKNLDAAFVGLVHYRRHFRGCGGGIATGEELAAALATCDVILPRPRRYFIETTYSQYIHAHHAADLDVTRQILIERHPDLVVHFDAVMKARSGHRFNMFIMRRELFDAYCTWLFDILFELERRLDISSYSVNDARVFGFVSERLLDVWLRRRAENGPLRVQELRVLHLESQHWPRKALAFLRRKFCARRLPLW